MMGKLALTLTLCLAVAGALDSRALKENVYDASEGGSDASPGDSRNFSCPDGEEPNFIGTLIKISSLVFFAIGPPVILFGSLFDASVLLLEVCTIMGMGAELMKWACVEAFTPELITGFIFPFGIGVFGVNYAIQCSGTLRQTFMGCVSGYLLVNTFIALFPSLTEHAKNAGAEWVNFIIYGAAFVVFGFLPLIIHKLPCKAGCCATFSAFIDSFTEDLNMAVFGGFLTYNSLGAVLSLAGVDFDTVKYQFYIQGLLIFWGVLFNLIFKESDSGGRSGSCVGKRNCCASCVHKIVACFKILLCPILFIDSCFVKRLFGPSISDLVEATTKLQSEDAAMACCCGKKDEFERVQA